MVFGTAKREELTKGRGTFSSDVSHLTGDYSVGSHRQPVLPGCKMSDSGKSSKLEVSSILLISIGMAAGLSLKKTIHQPW